MSRQSEPEMKLPSTSWVWAGLCGMSSAVTLMFRYGEGLFGTHNAIFGLAAIVLYAVFMPCPPLLIYAVVFAAFCVVKRFTTIARHRFGNRQIAEFQGWPLACLFLPEWLGRTVEPLIVWFAGQFLQQINRPLGWFFMAGAVATAIKSTLESAARLNREVGYSNQRIQMEIDARQRGEEGVVNGPRTGPARSSLAGNPAGRGAQRHRGQDAGRPAVDALGDRQPENYLPLASGLIVMSYLGSVLDRNSRAS